MADNVDDQMAQLMPDQQSVLKGMGVGAPGSPTLKPVTELGGGTPRPEPVDRFPALEKTATGVPAMDFKRQELDLSFGMLPEAYAPSLGVDIVTEATPRITDPKKISVDLTLQSVINFKNPQIASNFEKSIGVRNAQGQEQLFRVGQNLNERLDEANRFGATEIISSDGESYKVPWENLIYDMTRLPNPDQNISWNETAGEVEVVDGRVIEKKTIQNVLAKDMTPEQIERMRDATMLSSLNFIDPEIGKPLFADLMNEKMIRAGVKDARTRAAIVRDSISTPGMGDLEKIGSGIGENAIKFPVQFGLWGVGELIDVADEIIGRGLGLGDDTNLGSLDIRYSENRQAIMDTLWQPLSHRFVARMAQRGVKVPLRVAEEWMSTMTGLAPRVAKLTGEIVLPSKGAGAISAFRGKKELAEFKAFYNQQLASNKPLTYDETLELFKRKQAGIADNAEPTYIQKIRSKLATGRLARGMQVEDAAKAVGDRVQVKTALAAKDALVGRRDKLISGINKRGGIPNAKELQDLESLRIDIATAEFGLQAIIKKSATPKFMQDIATADKYMIVGAGTVGHYFQMRTDDPDYTGNPMMGELIGLFAGLALNVSAGSVPAAYQAFAQSSFGSKYTSKRQQIKYLVDNVTKFSPEMQEGIMERVRYLDEAYDTLLEEGVSQEVLSIGFAHLTGLATLKALEDITRSQLTVKELKRFATGSDLEKNLSLQKQLVNDLKEAVKNMDGGIGPSPKQDFFRLINRAIEVGEESIDELGRDIKTIQTQGLQHYLDTIDGNTAAYGRNQAPNTHTNFTDTVEKLQNQNIINAADVPRLEFNRVADETKNITAEVVQKHADAVRSSVGGMTQGQAVRAATRVVGPSGVKAEGQTVKSAFEYFDGPGDLIAALLESAHVADKTKAKRLYAQLDGAKFVSSDGNNAPIIGDVAVSVGDLFDAIFTGQPTLALGRMRKAEIAPGELAKLDETFTIMSDPFFASLAEGTEKTVKDVVNDIKKTPAYAAFESGKGLKGYGDRTKVVMFLREEARKGDSNLDVLNMSFTELRELDKSIRHVRYASNRAGDVEKAQEYRILESIVDKKFDEFYVIGPDGTRTEVGSLSIIRKNDQEQDEVVSVRSVLNEANREWGKFKSRWYDTNEKAIVPRWMAWGNRSTVDVSANNPLGIRYGDENPREWINIKEIAAKTPDEAKSWFDSLQRTLGDEVVNLDGVRQFTFVEGTPMTNAVASTIKTAVADYIINTRGRINANELSDQMDKINQTFIMRDANGKVKPMLGIDDIVEDAIGFSKHTVGENAYTAATNRAVSDINTQIEKMIQPVELAKKERQLAVQILRNFHPDKLGMDQIAERLIAGGSDQVKRLRSQLKEVGGFDEEKIDRILTEVYLDALQRKAFVPTGEMLVVSPNGKMIQDVEFDLDSTLDLLGKRDPETAKVVKELVGSRRYKVWEAVAQVMADRGGKSRREFDVTGVPRKFSVESIISRVYAINRGVISPKYVGTEAVLQQMRNNDYKLLSSVLSDPEVGDAFLEMVRTGKPLTPNRQTSFYNALVASAAKMANEVDKPEPMRIEDEYGREFTLYPKDFKNVPKTKSDAAVGEGVEIPIFKEIQKRLEDFPVTLPSPIATDTSSTIPGFPRIDLTLDDLPPDRQQPYREAIQKQE